MKKELRTICRERRNEMTALEVLNFSSDIVDKLMPLILKHDKIAIYLPMSGEVDVTSLLFLDRSFYAPVVLNDEAIEFFELDSTDNLKKGVLGILEPTSNVSIAPEELDVIIVPLLGFDEELNRLGHGKGYYDRYLKQTKALKIGVGFESQRLEEIPTDEFDVRLDYIVSELKIYHR